MKRKIEYESDFYINETEKIDEKREKRLVEEIHDKFFDETVLHLRFYHEASNKLEETLDEKQKSLFETFKIIAAWEGYERESALLQYTLAYLEKKFKRKRLLKKK